MNSPSPVYRSRVMYGTAGQQLFRWAGLPRYETSGACAPNQDDINVPGPGTPPRGTSGAALSESMCVSIKEVVYRPLGDLPRLDELHDVSMKFMGDQWWRSRSMRAVCLWSKVQLLDR